jgi:hypothetical protein
MRYTQLLFGLSSLLILACSNPSPEPEVVSNYPQAEIDSLNYLISEQDSTIQVLQDQLSAGVLVPNAQLDQLMDNITTSLLTINENQSQKALLALFLEEYSVNWINVENNTAQIVRTTHLDFKKELKKIAREDRKTKLSLKSKKLLSYDIQGSLYNAMFKIEVNETIDEKPAGTRSLTFSIVGRKKQGYKIANMNIFAFQQDK